MNLNKEIKKLAEQHLPKQVGDVLQKRLKRANEIEFELQELSELLIKKNDKINELTSIVSKINDLKIFEDSLKAKEKELNNLERNLELEKLKYQLESERDKTDFSMRVALGLVRNIEFRKTIFDSENQAPYQDSNGNWVYPTSLNKNLKETKIKE